MSDEEKSNKPNIEKARENRIVLSEKTAMDSINEAKNSLLDAVCIVGEGDRERAQRLIRVWRKLDELREEIGRG